MTENNDMVFRSIKIDFLSKGLNFPSPMYSISYEYMGFLHQGFYSCNMLIICRYLTAYFGMSEDDIELALKPVIYDINKAIEELEGKK